MRRAQPGQASSRVNWYREPMRTLNGNSLARPLRHDG
jgi:hypothetical protein